MHSELSRLRTLLVTALLCTSSAGLVAASCAGGGIGGSGGISGFGSVFVNGVEWFTSGAEITLDGQPGTEADLRIGMVVVFLGEENGDGTGQLGRLSFDDDVQGPVATLLPVSSTILDVGIFGELVRLEHGSTLFDDSDPLFGFDSVDLGDLLEVSGHRDASGLIHATWVRRLGVAVPGVSEVELEGPVSGLAGSSFTLAGVNVTIDGDTELGELGGPLANGMEVEVEGVLMGTASVLADSVAPRNGLPPGVAELSVEGFVSDFVDLSDFRVNGEPVDATGAIFFPPTPSSLADGVLVEVEGPLVNGVIVAEEVRFDLAEFALDAELVSESDVDPLARRVTLLGVAIDIAPTAEMEDGFSLEDLRAGDFLELRGVVDMEGDLVADELVRTDPHDVQVEGPVDSVDAAALRLTVVGIEIQADASTGFEDRNGASITDTGFFSTVEPGDMVESVDQEDADQTSFDLADELSIKN